MAYCSISEVRDKTVDTALTQAGWTDIDIQARIDEGGAYIDSKVLMLGYNQSQLSAASLIKNMNILYARFAILRDIFARVSPSKVNEAGFVKWKEQIDEMLEKIVKGEIKLFDLSGNSIIPASVDERYKVQTTTNEVKRIFTLTKPENWYIDMSYTDEDTTG